MAVYGSWNYSSVWCYGRDIVVLLTGTVVLLLKVFHDLGDERIVSQDSIVRGRFLGKGAFGAVYAGTMIDKVCIVTPHSAIAITVGGLALADSVKWHNFMLGTGYID